MAQEELKYLVRIASTDLDGKKPIRHALLKIKGVGNSFANMVCSFAGVDISKKAGYLTDEEVAKIEDVIKNPIKHKAPEWMLNRRRDVYSNLSSHLILADVSYVPENDIKRLKKIKSYKGFRHAYKRPVRGQRTRSNFRHNKGKVRLGVQRKSKK